MFTSADLREERAALPLAQIRLWCPFVTGDLYGSATTGDFIQAQLNPDYSFEIDLNRSHNALLSSLEKTRLSMPQLKIVPEQTRIARLAPMVMQADGIEQVGMTDWIDAQTKERLMLIYVDQAAALSGVVKTDKGSLRYDIRVDAPGYTWIRERTSGGDSTFTATAKPANVMLAVQMPAG
jgi:hypothetical protein